MKDESETIVYGANTRRTICEVLREIYDISVTLKEKDKIQEKLKEAYLMAKKMDKKLREYKDKSHKGYLPNEDFDRDKAIRELRRY